MLKLKNGESRIQDRLKTFKGLYILLHSAAEKGEEVQLDKAFAIAHDRRVPLKQTAQCQAACDDDKKLGHAVAIIKLGKTQLLAEKDLKTEQQRREWEHSTFVPAKKLKGMFVTEIEEVHPIPSPWKLKGQQGVFHAWVRLDNLPRDLEPDILQKSAVGTVP